MSRTGPAHRRWKWQAPLVALCLTSIVAAASAHAGPRDEGGLEQTLASELGLTRSAIAVDRGLDVLARQRGSIDHTIGVLEHAARDTLRRCTSYRDVAGERDAVARRRARALYRLAHGGAARLVFDGDAEARLDRIARGRVLARLVRHELRELSTHQRASDRATAELVSAARELQAIGTMAQVGPMQAHALRVASQSLAPAVADARKRSQRETGAASSGARRARAELLDELRRHREALARASAKDARRLVRPVPGPVVGAFGPYIDPAVRLPMNRDGVELRAAVGTAVRAMAGGEVVLVSPLPGFEQVVSIDHGDGRFSMTARLWHVTVLEGQSLEAGDIIGRVAPKAHDDGLGPTVYVELRDGERPVDPSGVFGR
jgi:murein hydrolase activator